MKVSRRYWAQPAADVVSGVEQHYEYQRRPESLIVRPLGDFIPVGEMWNDVRVLRRDAWRPGLTELIRPKRSLSPYAYGELRSQCQATRSLLPRPGRRQSFSSMVSWGENPLKKPRGGVVGSLEVLEHFRQQVGNAVPKL